MLRYTEEGLPYIIVQKTCTSGLSVKSDVACFPP
jgi:hypothetical protein